MIEEKELDMDILNDAPNRFVMANDDGDQLHIFRVPSGTVVHITDGDRNVSAMLIDDQSAPFVLKALARMTMTVLV